MKQCMIGILSLVFAVGAAHAADKTALKTEQEKTSYAMGMTIAQSLKQQRLEFDVDLFLKGFKDTYSGTQTLITEEEKAGLMIALQQKMKSKEEEMSKNIGEKNKKEGEAFLAGNKAKADIKTTASGLQYKVLKQGSGPIPKEADTVSVHYKGTLIDGTEFDSSYKRGEPVSFPVNGVIAGWTEALKLMKTGSKYQLFIPSALAYGERGAGRAIGPNAVLIFEVELISIQ